MMTVSELIVYKYRWVILGVLWTAYVVIFMQRLSIGPLGPALKNEMGLDSTQVGSLVSAAAFGYMLSMIPAGWVTDKIGIRRILLIGEGLAGIFMLGMLWAPSYEVALVIMAMSGFGCGCLFPSTTKGIMVWFPVRERATVMGLKQTGTNIGGIITAATLPGIALVVGWRFGFVSLGILSIVVGILSFILYKDPPVPVASRSGDSTASTDVATPARNKLLRELLKSRDIWMIILTGVTLGLITSGMIAHLVLYLTESLSFPVVAAGMILSMTQAGGILGKPGGGFLSDRFFSGSRRKALMVWAGITCATCLLIALWGASLSWGLYPTLFILGMTAFGWSGIHLTLIAELVGKLGGKEVVATGTGIIGAISYIGAICGPALFGYFVDISGSYQPAWLACTVFAAICLAALFFMREERRRI